MRQETYDAIQQIKDIWEVDIEEGTIKSVRGQKTSMNEKGYLTVSAPVDGVWKTFKVHQIIAALKWGDECVGKVIDHIDGNKLHNSWHNLELVSYKENTMRAVVMGLNKAAADNKQEAVERTKLTAIDVAYIRAKLDARENTIIGLSRLFNISQTQVSNIAKGKTWIEVQPIKAEGICVQGRLF